MQVKPLFACAALALTGCYDIDDVRRSPIVWTETYSVAFDTMANCLAVEYGREYSVVPQLYQREKRANVTLTMPSGSAVISEFQIRQTTDTLSSVSWQRIGGTPGIYRPVDRESRERADKCARA